MGRKGYQIPKIVEKILNESPKSGKELKTLINKELGGKIPSHFQKTFDQGLIQLLEEEKIQIAGYNPSDDSRKVKQAFKSDAIIFDSSKRLTRPDIRNKLSNMNEKKEDYQEIRKIFKNKLRELDSYEKKRWEELNKNVFCSNRKELINLMSKKYDLEKLESKFENTSNTEIEILFKTLYDKRKIRKSKQLYSNLFESFQNDEFFFGNPKNALCAGLLLKYLDFFNSDDLKIWYIPISLQTYRNYFLNLNPYEGFKIPTKGINKEINVKQMISTIFKSDIIIDPTGNLSKAEILYRKQFKTSYRKINDLDLAFEHSIDILSTYSAETRDILFGILSKALSNEPGSLDIFRNFYIQIESVDYNARLKRVIGIFEQQQ